MGILRRISNIFKSKTNDALDKLETPIQLLDQKIIDMEDSLNKAKVSSAQVLGNVHETKKKMEQAEKDMKDYDEKVKKAIEKNDEGLAKKALSVKIVKEKDFIAFRQAYGQAKVRADEIKERLTALEKEIGNTRRYRDEATARYNSAKATEKVNEILAGIETKTNSVNLGDIERKIQKKESYAEGLSELKPIRLEDEFAKLDEVNLDDELAKYKAKATEADNIDYDLIIEEM